MFLLRKRFWITVGKVVALLFPTFLLLVQIPELRYDLGSGEPVEITSPEDLETVDFGTGQSLFVSVEGRIKRDRAFVYTTHGLSYTYFLVEPHGPRLVVRTPQQVTDEWEQRERFSGKFQPFERMPFRGRIRDAFRSEFDVEVPADAYYLGHGDVPAVSGWNVAAVIFSVLLWLGMFYGFFLLPRRKKPRSDAPTG